MRSIGLLIFPRFQLLDAAGPDHASLRRPGASAVRNSTGCVPSRALGRSGRQARRVSRWSLRRFRPSRYRTSRLRYAGRRRRVGYARGVGLCRDAGFRAPRGIPRAACRQRLFGRIRARRGRVARRAPRGRPTGRAPPSWRALIRASRVEPDRIFIRDGEVWTSAGITAGIDLALALAADDLGESVAKRAAQHLVVYYRRPGGQSQFSALLEADRPGGRFSPLLAWARERLGERLPVERLADRAAMSPRHFARAFSAPRPG